MHRLSRWLLVIAVALLLVAAVTLRWAASQRPPVRTPPAAQHESAADAPSHDPHAAPVGGATAGTDLAASEPFIVDDPLVGPTPATRDPWELVDLAEVQRALPDNLYWKMAAPTKDAEIQRERDEERARWNVEYGKVLSNTATDEEIDAFYAQRQRLSEDYLEFIVYLGTHYGDLLTPKDLAMLKLAGEMHHERLEELPRKIAEAHERHRAHEAARQAWLEQQKAFDAPPPTQ